MLTWILVVLILIAVWAQSASAYAKYCARELEAIRKLAERQSRQQEPL